MKRRLLRILPYITTFIIMAIIFFFSSQTREESSELSTGITEWMIDCFMRIADVAEKEKYIGIFHNIVRKLAHFTLYALLAFSASGMFRVKRGLHRWIYTVIFCVLYAITDELHPVFVSGRGARVSDVLLDGCGAAFGAMMFGVVYRIVGALKGRELL